MDRREQRARRDRKKDARPNPVHKAEEKETTTKNSINKKSAPSDIKEKGSNKVEVTTDKSAIKDKVVEDDPLRFANLKRETDEIAALKAKKPQKRQVFSNWWRYEEPLPSANESQAVDFETLLHVPQSGNFKFKSERHWDAGSFGQYGELFMPDADLLVAGLTSIPFYVRLGIDKSLLLEDEVEKLDSCAKTNSVAYEKVHKSKQKPKRDVTDLFSIDFSDKYSVVGKENVSPMETGSKAVAVKPKFVVEQSPEPIVTFLKPLTDAALDNVQPVLPSREGTPAKERGSEGALQNMYFEKPTPPPSSTASRESTPAKDIPKEASEGFDFGRQAHVTPDNPEHPLPGNEGTPAEEVVSLELKSSRDTEEELELAANHPSNEQHTLETVALSQNSIPSGECTQSWKDVRNSPEGTELVTMSKNISPVEIPSEEEQRMDSPNTGEQPLKQTNSKNENLVSEQKSDVLGGYPQKGGKAESRKHDSNQKGGGKHSRRKKGQQSFAQEREQVEVEVSVGHPKSVRPENRSDENEQNSTSNADLSQVEKTLTTETCPPPEVKKKPELPTPPLLRQPTPAPEAALPAAGIYTQGAVSAAFDERAAHAPVKKIPLTTKEKTSAQGIDDHLNFLMSLRGQKAAGISEVEAAKSLQNTAVSRSAIEEDEVRESQKLKAPPAITTDKKEDLENWLDSMLDD